MPQDPQLITADTILPMVPGLPQIMQNAGVVIREGRILGVGELSDLRRQFGALPLDRDRRPGTLLPGLINAHTHLELSYQSAAQLQAPHFTQWVKNLMTSYPPPDQLDARIRAAFRRGIADSLAAGVTTLGDISRQAPITRDEFTRMAAQSLILPRLVSFGEVVGLGKKRDRALPMIAAAASQTASAVPQTASSPPLLVSLSPPLLTPGISPHAPYTVDGPTLRACVRQAILKRLPLAMHLAELPEETQFLRDLSGKLGRDWDLMLKMDLLDDSIPQMLGGPIRWAQRWSLLTADAHAPTPRSFPILLAHVNYCDDGELAQLAASRVSVAYCPRTHAYFGHPPHRFADMLASEINVCLATDSLASNPDLSVLKEAQFVHQKYQTDPHTLLEMITSRPARALGLQDQTGSLAPGKQADMILLPLSPADNLLTQIITQAPTPTTIWINGQPTPLPKP